MRFEIDRFEYTLQGLRDEDAQNTNNMLELVELIEEENKLAMLGIQVTRNLMLDMRIGEVTMLSSEVSRMITLDNLGDWDPMLDRELPGATTLRVQGGGDPMFGLGEVGTSIL